MYVMSDRRNITKHVNSIPANVGIEFLMFVLKPHSGKGQYSMMPRKTIRLLWTWFCPNRATGSCGTSVLQDKAWEACFILKLQTAFGNTSLRSFSASLHVKEEMKFELLN